MGLIRSTLITYLTHDGKIIKVFDVPEADIRQALIYEAAEKHGGVTGKVSFNGRKGGGSYTVTLTPRKAASPRFPAS